MSRRVWLRVLLLAGWHGVSCHHTQPVGVIPPPSNASGAWVVLEDNRPAWERRPETLPVQQTFEPVKLYPLWHITSPNVWVQLARETEAVVAAMPEKPERVKVVVESCRLAERNGVATKAQSATQGDGPPQGALEQHPPGASCSVCAVVRVTFRGGREQVVNVNTIASGENEIRTRFEAIDFAAKAAVQQYGRQFRQGIGLSPDR